MKRKKYSEDDHTFVICAYKESEYLEECIFSLMNQSIKIKHIVIATSTHNQYIYELANKYQIDYYVNEQKSRGIADDWNFAYSQAKTPLVTIAHQDDIYCTNYLQNMLQHLNNSSNPLIAFGDYGEIRDGQVVIYNKLLNIKRVMLLPLKIKYLWKSKFVRRRILSFGSAICCPSVTYVKEELPHQIFQYGYRSDLDWQTWENLSKLQGSYVYCDKISMYHRIHMQSATTAIIADNDRTKEDYEMFCKFWPEWIARIFEFFYKKGEHSNTV